MSALIRSESNLNSAQMLTQVCQEQQLIIEQQDGLIQELVEANNELRETVNAQRDEIQSQQIDIECHVQKIDEGLKTIADYQGLVVMAQEIVEELTTDSSTGDPTAFPTLLTQINRRVKEVIADGAYDSGDIRDLIKHQGGKALIPPPKNGVCSGMDANRDQAVLDIRSLGGDKIARSIWGKLTGYSRRALVETAVSRYKKMFGERAFSRTYERQIVENRLKCLLMNKMIKAAA